MRQLLQVRPGRLALAAAWLGMAFVASCVPHVAAAAVGSSQSLAEANSALQAGEADKALALLGSGPTSGDGAALTHNLICRVRFTMGQWDAAASECQQAVRLDGQSSEYHLWLARALGEKAGSASFLSAFSLAKQSRAEFEESVRLNPRNAAALADLGDFYCEAPGVVGGGVDKAQQIAGQLEKVDAAKAHHLRAQIAEQQKDYAGAERELKQAVAASAHPALEQTGLASFYARRKRYDDAESTIRGVLGLASHDKNSAVALYDGAGVLIAAGRNSDLAASLLEAYLASANKTEEAPAFIAHIRLARVKARLGDSAGASRERAAALALASEYKPARDFKPNAPNDQEARL